MKIKRFQEYLEQRLDKAEIAELEQQAEFEYQSLCELQKELAAAITEYAKKEKSGFNELVRRLGISPAQLTKIQAGKANVTLATIAHVGALFKRKPHLIFKRAANS